MRLKFLLLIFFIAWMLAACFRVSSLKDPFGAYEAKVTMAQYDREARIVEAEQAAWAKVGSARAWSNIVPTVSLIIGLSLVVGKYIQWQGRITLARIQSGMLPKLETSDHIADADLEELKTVAAQRNQQFEVVNGIALLIDKRTGEIVKRRSL